MKFKSLCSFIKIFWNIAKPIHQCIVADWLQPFHDRVEQRINSSAGTGQPETLKIFTIKPFIESICQSLTQYKHFPIPLNIPQKYDKVNFHIVQWEGSGFLLLPYSLALKKLFFSQWYFKKVFIIRNLNIYKSREYSMSICTPHRFNSYQDFATFVYLSLFIL